MKKTHIEYKIDEVYDIALKLGLDKASNTEKEIFKKALFQIVTTTISDIRHNINNLLYDQDYKYTNINNKK